MSGGFNRALQVRVANRLRAQLAIDPASSLPLIDGLSEADQHDLCESGGGRLAAVLVTLVQATAESAAVAQRIAGEVRRTDILGVLDAGQLLLLSPGLDPVGGQSLVERLYVVLGDEVAIGVAYRSGASASGWTLRGLAAEAAQQAQNSMGASLLV
jgi:hypothetical protein